MKPSINQLLQVTQEEGVREEICRQAGEIQLMQFPYSLSIYLYFIPECEDAASASCHCTCNGYLQLTELETKIRCNTLIK